MAHTTLASTDRSLEKIGEFVSLKDYPSLKAVGRTFVQKAGVMVGLRRSIPKYNKKGKRRLAALELQARSLGSAAEPYLLLALREDSSQGVRGAAAQWLARIARHGDEDVRVRLYGVLAERYDAEARMMTLRAALAESCSHDTPTLEQHYPGRALTAAAAESSAARARDAEIAAFDASGRTITSVTRRRSIVVILAQIRVMWPSSARSLSASPWPARPSPRSSWKI